MKGFTPPILCLDFDGVVHSYSSGWQGVDVIPDPPVAGAFDFILRAMEHFQVCIYSARSGQPRGIWAMRKWFLSHDFPAERMHWDDDVDYLSELGMDPHHYPLQFPEHKPPAFLTIDDRVLRFDGTWPTIETITDFKPWTPQDV